MNKLNIETKLSNTPHEYRKVMTRALSLIDCELWDIGDRLMLPSKFNDLVFFDPLFIFTPGKALAVYYNFTDPKQDLQQLINFLENNIEWLKKEQEKFDYDCQLIRNLMNAKSNDHEELTRLIKEIWPMISVADTLSVSEIFSMNDALKEICIAVREESNDVLHASMSYLRNIILDLISEKEHVDYILHSEFINKTFPPDHELQKRRDRWFFHKGKIGVNIEEYCKQQNIRIVEDIKSSSDENIFGKVASPGTAIGRVKIVFEIDDLTKIQTGDILVSPMTTPEMILAIKKVSAIVTDEGGIICHAAITARELKIPCIIGTKNATQVLQDGDLVEVDANSGNVKVLKREN